MATDFHIRVREVIEGALQRPPEERERYIAQAVGQDAELLREVRSLLPHYLEVAGFEPQRPGGLAWRLPGTTTFGRVLDVERDEEWTPPFSIAPYTVVAVLGRGGMGVVYRAIHPTRHTQVAIKLLRRRVLTREDRRRFAQEGEVLRQLNHPGIARYFHNGIARIIRPEPPHALSERRPYFVMEYVAGLPLTRYAERHDLTALERVALLGRVCEAVEYAHHRGIVHRDLKPDNILVDETGQPKILDFGIALVHVDDLATIGDHGEHFIGTPAYASPEQRARTSTPLTPASDVYTLGLIAHELLTGRLPTRTGGRVALHLDGVRLVTARGDDESTSASFRYSIKVILATALRKTRGQRYAMAGEMGADLEQVCRVYSADTGWRALAQRWVRFMQWRTSETPEQPNRLLAAVLRKRIGLAMELEDHIDDGGSPETAK